VEESDDARNARLQQEITSRPGWAELEKDINMRQGTGPVSPSDLKDAEQPLSHDYESIRAQYQNEQAATQGGAQLLDADELIANIEANPNSSPEEKEIQRQAIEGLREAWGPYAFKENFRDYDTALRAAVTSPQEFEEFIELHEALGLGQNAKLQVQVARQLSRMGRRLREKYSAKK
jgi:hypothetical protein